MLILNGGKHVHRRLRLEGWVQRVSDLGIFPTPNLNALWEPLTDWNFAPQTGHR